MVESAGSAASAEGPTPSPLQAAPVRRRRAAAIARGQALRCGEVEIPIIDVASPLVRSIDPISSRQERATVLGWPRRQHADLEGRAAMEAWTSKQPEVAICILG